MLRFCIIFRVFLSFLFLSPPITMVGVLFDLSQDAGETAVQKLN
jgi:hypothetical protein